MALRMVKLSSLLCLLVVILVVLDGAGGSDFCELVVEPLGYGCTEFSVETDDGFVLVMHRLSRIQSLVGDELINGTAQTHVVNSGDNVTGKVQLSQGGDKRVQCDSPNDVVADLIPGSRTVFSADSNGSRNANDSASSTLEPDDHLCSCSCYCSHGSNTPKDASCTYERNSAQNASTSLTSKLPIAPSSPANYSAPNSGNPIRRNNSCECSCWCVNDATSQEAHCHGSSDHDPMFQVPESARNGSRHTDHAQPHTGLSKDAAQDGMLPNEPGRSTPASDASVSSTQNASTSSTPTQQITGNSRPSNYTYTANPLAGKDSPVLLMHMEFLNGDTWFKYVDVDRHVSRLLPILLLEDGFDVWIGHQRATYWGHGHVKHKFTDREYWNWTWDEHAKYDLPAQLSFISTETNQPVHFIGASQAATVALAAATNHETAQMFRSLTLIGPTAFRGDSNSFLLNAWAYFFGAFLDTQYYSTGFQNGAFNYSMEFPQNGPISGEGLNGLTIGLMSGPNCCLGSASIEFTNGWDGTTSFKNLLHWQQGIRTNSFTHYDYGNPLFNIQAYGRPIPPAFNVTLIPSQLPMLIIGGGSDWIAPPQGTNLLVSQMQQSVTIVNLTSYAHFDLLFSFKREIDVYLPILQFLEGSDFE